MPFEVARTTNRQLNARRYHAARDQAANTLIWALIHQGMDREAVPDIRFWFRWAYPIYGVVLAMLVVLMPRDLVMGRLVDESRTRIAGAARVAYSAVGAPYAAVLVAAGTFSPFLYFQF